jgi:hypothetical protein
VAVFFLESGEIVDRFGVAAIRRNRRMARRPGAAAQLESQDLSGLHLSRVLLSRVLLSRVLLSRALLSGALRPVRIWPVLCHVITAILIESRIALLPGKT